MKILSVRYYLIFAHDYTEQIMNLIVKLLCHTLKVSSTYNRIQNCKNLYFPTPENFQMSGK